MLPSVFRLSLFPSKCNENLSENSNFDANLSHCGTSPGPCDASLSLCTQAQVFAKEDIVQDDGLYKRQVKAAAGQGYALKNEKVMI